MTRIRDLSTFNAVRSAGLAKLQPSRPRIAVGMGTCGTGNGAEGVYTALTDAIAQRGLDVHLVRTGCFGFCAEEPLVNVWIPGQPLVILHRVRTDHVNAILDALTTKTVPERLALCKIEDWDHITAQMHFGDGYPAIPVWNEVPFFRGQKKIVLRNCGLINPDDVEEYIAIGGYQSLYKVLIDGTPELVNEQVKISRLRGRGGAGFSTGLKWEFMRKAVAEHKYLICNADEGDPGAYMNRNELEGDPHSLIEGMAIGGYITGAEQGIIYVRAEYPLAVHRLKVALAQAQGLRRARRRHPGARLQVRHRLGRGRRRLRLRRRDGADQFARRTLRPAAAAAALPRPKGPVGLSDQHQQRRNLVQHRPHRRQRAGLVHRDRQQRKRRDQGVFAGRQSEEHRPRRNAVRHAAVELRLRRRGRQHARPSGEGGADRRSVRRLHPA